MKGIGSVGVQATRKASPVKWMMGSVRGCETGTGMGDRDRQRETESVAK